MSVIVDEFLSSETTVSIELFPPKSEAAVVRLVEEVERIQDGMRVAFTSVTYGAGGSTRDGTLNLVLDLSMRYPGRVVAHLTCVGADEESLSRLMMVYQERGMGDIMALRGDIPEGMTREEATAGGFRYAIDLVRWLGKLGGVSSIGVAGYPEGHPETPERSQDLEYFIAKADAGADYAATQFFFENSVYFNFIEEAARRGLEIPVAPGILPVRDLDQVIRFASMCGANVPEHVITALEPYREDPEEFLEKSADLAAEQIGGLIEAGVRHIHLYSLNKSDLILRIADRLGWSR